ncbi:MAG: mercuric transport protein periplasmic component [Alphaproteobacteria bacterium]|nr:MAG: mercuric transport protein periplasmic component [Alphaproteobacteria bacterium]
MKRIIIAFIFLFSAMSYTAYAGIVTTTLQVENMTCASCPIIVKKALISVAGVGKVTVDLETAAAIVTFDDSKTDIDEIIAATGNAGFPSKVKVE